MLEHYPRTSCVADYGSAVFRAIARRFSKDRPLGFEPIVEFGSRAAPAALVYLVSAAADALLQFKVAFSNRQIDIICRHTNTSKAILG